MVLRFGYYEIGPCCTQMAQILQHSPHTLFKHKFNNVFTLYFQVFPPSCLQLAWSISTLHTSLLPTQPPNSKHSHTCYCRTAHKWCTTGIVFSSILKEKHTAFVFQLGASSLLTITVKLLKEFLRFIFFLLQGSTMKSHYKNYFYLCVSSLEC